MLAHITLVIMWSYEPIWLHKVLGTIALLLAYRKSKLANSIIWATRTQFKYHRFWETFLSFSLGKLEQNKLRVVAWCERRDMGWELTDLALCSLSAICEGETNLTSDSLTLPAP